MWCLQSICPEATIILICRPKLTPESTSVSEGEINFKCLKLSILAPCEQEHQLNYQTCDNYIPVSCFQGSIQFEPHHQSGALQFMI